MHNEYASGKYRFIRLHIRRWYLQGFKLWKVAEMAGMEKHEAAFHLVECGLMTKKYAEQLEREARNG
jgi:hypothetical protein